MLLRFINELQDRVLNSYYLSFCFQTREKKPTFYKLELIAELRSYNELLTLESTIKKQLMDKFDLVNSVENEIKTKVERMVIENNLKTNFRKHVPMKFLFKKWIKTGDFGEKITEVLDVSIGENGVKDFKANILKSGGIPFNLIEDLFVLEILTNEYS